MKLYIFFFRKIKHLNPGIYLRCSLTSMSIKIYKKQLDICTIIIPNFTILH